MTVRGWLIVGTDGATLPPTAYRGDFIGNLPPAANYKPGQWLYWRPVAGTIAGTSTQVAVVCIEVSAEA